MIDFGGQFLSLNTVISDPIYIYVTIYDIVMKKKNACYIIILYSICYTILYI